MVREDKVEHGEERDKTERGKGSVANLINLD